MSPPESPAEGSDDPAPSFETALAALDRVVGRLESGEVGLEEAVALFEQGQRHLRVCRERLGVAQKRIEELTADELPADSPESEDDDTPF